MNDSEQTTFGNVTVVSANRGTCNKVNTVENGSRNYCGNSAKIRIKRPNAKDELRCGIHDKHYAEMIENDE